MRNDQVWLCDVLDELCRLVAHAWENGLTPRAIVLNPAIYDAVARARSEEQLSRVAISLLGFDVRSSESVAVDRPELVFEHE